MFNSVSVRFIEELMRSKRGSYCVALGGILVLSGCGGSYDSSVEGVVTLDGKAVPRGLVAFHPMSAGPAAYAMIDDHGGYTVRTGRETGLPSGDYQVSVTANEPPAVARTEQGFPPPAGKSITPAWYSSKETSGLQFNIAPGSNQINLELTSKPPAGWKRPGR
jgi:hypothetical protein